MLVDQKAVAGTGRRRLRQPVCDERCGDASDRCQGEKPKATHRKPHSYFGRRASDGIDEARIGETKLGLSGAIFCADGGHALTQIKGGDLSLRPPEDRKNLLERFAEAKDARG